MENFEDNIIKNYQKQPKTWWRYVDDIFIIWPHNVMELDNFLDYVNNAEPTIKFTLEIESNNQLPFLDVLIEKSNNIFVTSVYRKKTHTNRYLNFQSNHQNSIKKGIIKSLHDRAKSISSDQQIFNNEVHHIKNVLQLNSYPKNFVDRTIHRIENKQGQPQQNQPSITTNIIPYIPGISEKIKRVGDKFQVKTVFKTENTMRSILTQTKPKRKNNRQKIVFTVYLVFVESFIQVKPRDLLQ